MFGSILRHQRPISLVYVCCIVNDDNTAINIIQGGCYQLLSPRIRHSVNHTLNKCQKVNDFQEKNAHTLFVKSKMRLTTC